jgi:hypothetical protein
MISPETKWFWLIVAAERHEGSMKVHTENTKINLQDTDNIFNSIQFILEQKSIFGDKASRYGTTQQLNFS